jgi:hypothetical protein
MLRRVAMQPLIAAQVYKTVHQAKEPFSARLSLLAAVKYITLMWTPLFDNDSLKQMMPSQCMLLGHHMSHRRINVRHVDRPGLSPQGQACEEGRGQGWISMGLVEIRRNLLQAGIPNCICVLAVTPIHVEGGLRSTAARACSIILVIPLDEGCTDAAIVGGGFGNPSALGRRKRNHEAFCTFPVNVIEMFLRQVIMPNPPHQCWSILKPFVKISWGRVSDLILAVPDLPSLVLDGRSTFRDRKVGPGVYHLSPEPLGGMVHRNIEAS